MEASLQTLLSLLDRLNEQLREVREGVQRAIRIAEVDPEMALARSRKVLELLVREVFERRVGEPPGTRPLENLIQRLVKDGYWPARLEAYASTVRMLGNLGVHRFGEKVSAADVHHSLLHLLPILEWFFESERPDALSPRSEQPGQGGSRLDAQTAAAPAALASLGAERSEQPAKADTGFQRLLALAKPTHRIWPCVVTQHTRDSKGAAYILSAFGAAHEGTEHRIRLGSRVFWAVQWDTEAHLLLLDDGPEGKTFCLCPSWFVPDTRLRPGVTLLPPESARCEPFVVTGVPGREQLVALLTEQPLPLNWMPPDQRIPARVLTEADFADLLALIQKLRPGSWTALATHCEVYV